MLRRIYCVVFQTAAGAETIDDSIVQWVPGAEPAMRRCPCLAFVACSILCGFKTFQSEPKLPATTYL